MNGILKYRFLILILLTGLFSFNSLVFRAETVEAQSHKIKEANRLVLHDFHTSLAELRLNPTSGSLEITLRVFTDDFQLALETANGGNKVDLEKKAADAVIELYLKKHFAFVKDKEVRFAQYLGKEVEADATWLYMELPSAKTLTGFKLLNSIFTELFDNQSNMVNFIYPNERITLLFSKDDKLRDYPF